MNNASLWSLEKLQRFDTRIDTYIDGEGNSSVMKWIPPFRSARALTADAAAATPSGTIGDWLHPVDIDPGWTEDTDYKLFQMGGYWADMYLCSSPDASATSAGTVADGTTIKAYVSQPGVVPRVEQNIGHFKTYLAARFATGSFASTGGSGFAGKGGLMTDAHWNELWVWSRINRLTLMGNTNGDNVTPKIPVYHGDSSQIGIIDPTQSTNGASLTGAGPKVWDTILSDICGNRWEFVDGLRLNGGRVYSAGTTIDPPGNYADAAYTDTLVDITGVTSGDSVSSYRTEAAVELHSIAASTTTAGSGRFDGQGWVHDSSGERIARRGGNSNNGAQCPGAVRVNNAPSNSDWYIGARAVLVP